MQHAYCYNLADMDTNQKQKSQFWVGMMVSLICLVAIFFFIEPAEILAALETARWGYLGLTAVGIILFLLIRAVRWRFMLNNDISLANTFHIQNIGYLVNNFLPLRLGDVAQAVLIGSVPPVTIARGLSTVVVTRILDMLFMVILLPFTLASVDTLPEQVQSTALVIGILTTAVVVVLVIAANQRPLARKWATAVFSWIARLNQWLAARTARIAWLSRVFTAVGRLNVAAWVNRVDDLLVGLSSLTSLKSGFILLLTTILTWLPIIAAYYFGLLAVNLTPTPAMAGFVVCAAALSVAAPSSPGQIGVFHAGVIFALTTILGQPEGQAASFAFLYHAINLTTTTLLGIVGLLATGATFRHVIDATRQFANRTENKPESLS